MLVTPSIPKTGLICPSAMIHMSARSATDVPNELIPDLFELAGTTKPKQTQYAGSVGHRRVHFDNSSDTTY